MNSTVPVQTLMLMRGVLAIRTRSSACPAYGDARGLLHGEPSAVDRIVATPAQLRRFVRLSHHNYVLSHLCIDRCLQRCLDTPLG
ncbi:hypothetical protein BO94DRAFT_604586 [Aspergillus sclerotioniger CBS 115572]|uniref:Secreted protein n=1 Tax=Aspergillus sclerotioniger CBS 115572 TaxID=1450535 RepID=A0A317VVC0_9EURO|nr:hypothetical protein BO94DRAFT_604586 [Aspergillus sclerotioniger CBS 115572]PWY77301.1 hypothetical protein BO94DRAFT_604586 [Aspergillus sclerotioniger CBS 115572]